MKVQNKEYEKTLFNQIAENGHYETLSDEFYDYLFAFLKRHMPEPAGKMLEAGCGTGAFGKRFVSQYPGLSILGADISEVMVRQADDGTPRYSAVNADLEDQAQWKTGEFDHIVCPFIMHHFPDITRVVENYGRWIKPGGYIILIEPNGNNFINKISKALRKTVELFKGKDYVLKKGWATPNETDHTVQTYDRIFQKNGFDLVARESFLFIDKDFRFRSLMDIKTILYKMVRRVFPGSFFSGSSMVFIYLKNR